MIYKKIDSTSGDCVTSALDVFHTPGTNVGVIRTNIKEFLTLNPVIDPPYHFKIPPGANYVDLSETLLIVEGKFTWHDNTDNTWKNIRDADTISTIQGLGSTFMRNLKVSIGGKEVFNANNLYAYKTYFDTLLNYSLEAKRTHLAACGWYEDITERDQEDAAGEGFISRKKMITTGKLVQFVTKLDVDLFNQERYFINNTPIDIEIIPNSNEFMFIAPTLNGATMANAKFDIQHLRLRVTFPEVSDGLSLTMAETLLMKPAVYPQRKTILKTVYLEVGRTEVNVNVFTEIIPRRVVMAMVGTAAYNGDFSTSPFNFKGFDLRNHYIEWNGVRTSSAEYDMDFASRYVLPYYDTCHATGVSFTNASNGLTLSRFKSGSTIFVWNLTSNLQNDACFELLKYGTTSYHAKFAQPIPHGGITLIFYGEVDSLMKIDYTRSVTTDLTI